MNKHQAEAISQMAENLHDYNRGVLAMLGKSQVAIEHEMVCRTIEMLIEQRNALSPEADSLFVAVALSPEQEEIQQQIDWNVARRNAAWAPIQALIDEARAALDAADPMGMGMSA